MIRKASYKNIQFNVSDTDEQFGRRGQIYEHPNNQPPAFADLGPKITKITIDGFFAGADHLQKWHELKKQCNHEVGLLVTPFGERLHYAVAQNSSVKHAVGGTKYNQIYH